MKKIFNTKFVAIAASFVLLSALAAPQLKTILKAGGVVAVISAFGKDMNNGLNKLWGRKDNDSFSTKVVPIITAGKGTAIGAAQVMGPENQVRNVIVVVQPETSLMGVRLKALIPVSDKNTSGGLKIVNGVGVSGIIDLKL